MSTLSLEKISTIERENLLIHIWLRAQQSPETRKKYERILKAFLKFAGKTSLLDIRAPVINVFLSSIASKRHVKTVAGYRAALSSLFTSLTYNGYRTDNPIAHVKKYKVTVEDIFRYLPPEVMDSVIEAAKPGRDRALIKIMYWTGMRVSETISLSLSNFIVGYEVVDIVVTGKGNKTRRIRISKSKFVDLMEELDKFGDGLIDKNAPLFLSNRQTRISRCQVWRILVSAGEKTGVKIAPHFCRHSHATTALKRGASLKSVQRSLGHESIVTTSRYQHLIDEKSPSDYI